MDGKFPNTVDTGQLYAGSEQVMCTHTKPQINEGQLRGAGLTELVVVDADEQSTHKESLSQQNGMWFWWAKVQCCISSHLHVINTTRIVLPGSNQSLQRSCFSLTVHKFLHCKLFIGKDDAERGLLSTEFVPNTGA